MTQTNEHKTSRAILSRPALFKVSSCPAPPCHWVTAASCHLDGIVSGALIDTD